MEGRESKQRRLKGECAGREKKTEEREGERSEQEETEKRKEKEREKRQIRYIESA